MSNHSPETGVCEKVGKAAKRIRWWMILILESHLWGFYSLPQVLAFCEGKLRKCVAKYVAAQNAARNYLNEMFY